MATAYATTTDWFLIAPIQPFVEYANKVEGKGSASSGKRWKRKVEEIAVGRYCKDLTSFADVTGNTNTGNNITFTNGADVVTGNASRTYTCVLNTLQQEGPPGSQMYLEVRKFRWEQDWSEESLPADASGGWDPTP